MRTKHLCVLIHIRIKGEFDTVEHPVPKITERLRGFTIKYEENFERSIGTVSTTHIFANDLKMNQK